MTDTSSPIGPNSQGQRRAAATGAAILAVLATLLGSGCSGDPSPEPTVDASAEADGSDPVEQLGSENAEPATPPEPPPEPEREYTMFWDQGDHFEELISAERYLDAARLIEHEKPYFVEVQERYRDDILLIARQLNDPYQAPLDEAVAAMNKLRWPSPVEAWPGLRLMLQQVETVLGAYNEVEILQIKPYRSEQAELLELKLAQAYRRLDRFMVETFILYDHFSQPPFFDMWPVEIDAPQFMAENFALIVPRLETASRLELVDFLGKYPESVMGEIAFVQFSNLYAAAYVRDLGLGPVPDLRAVMNAFEAVRQSGFKPNRIAGLKVALVQVLNSVPDAVSGLSFPIEMETDVTLVEVETAPREEALITPLARAADVLFVVDIVGRDVDQQVQSVEVGRSLRPAGTASRVNPAYEVAREHVVKARMARLQDEGGGDSTSSSGLLGLFDDDNGEAAPQGPPEDDIEIDFDTALDILLNTPPTVEAATYEPYEYERLSVEGRKLANVNYYVEDRRSGRSREGSLSLLQSETFTVIRGLRDDDPKREKIMAESITEADWAAWQQAPFTVKVSDLLGHYLSN